MDSNCATNTPNLESGTFSLTYFFAMGAAEREREYEAEASKFQVSTTVLHCGSSEYIPYILGTPLNNRPISLGMKTNFWVSWPRSCRFINRVRRSRCPREM